MQDLDELIAKSVVAVKFGVAGDVYTPINSHDVVCDFLLSAKRQITEQANRGMNE